jgi:hypothetical protein
MSTFEAEPAAETLPGYDHVIYESLDPPKEAEPEIFSGGKTGLDEAAAELTQTRAERNEVVERGFSDPEDYTKPAPGNYQVSAEHAADVLKETREWECRFAQSEADAELAKQIDEIRGEQPQAFKLYEQQTPEPQPESAPETPKELDQLLTGVGPEQKQRIIHDLGQYAGALQAQAQSVVQQYQQGVVETLLTAEAAALAPYPELHGVPRDQIQAVLAHIGRTDPAKHAQITQHVARVKDLVGKQLIAAQTLQQHQQAMQQEALKTKAGGVETVWRTAGRALREDHRLGQRARGEQNKNS